MTHYSDSLQSYNLQNRVQKILDFLSGEPLGRYPKSGQHESLFPFLGIIIKCLTTQIDIFYSLFIPSLHFGMIHALFWRKCCTHLLSGGGRTMLFLSGLFLGCVFGIIAVHNNPTISPNSHTSLIISNSLTCIGLAGRLPAFCLNAFRRGVLRCFSRSSMLFQFSKNMNCDFSSVAWWRY